MKIGHFTKFDFTVHCQYTTGGSQEFQGDWKTDVMLTFRGSKHKRRRSIFFDIRQIVFRKACKLTPNSWESFSRIFYQASQMCWLSLWSESTRYKTFLLVGMSIRKVVKGIASFCAGQKYSAMKRPGADILQSSRDVKDTSDILEIQEQTDNTTRWSDDHRWSNDYQEQMCFMQRWPFEILVTLAG